MLTRNRLYTKKEPDKDAKLFIIFCEGQKREYTYFEFFNGIASQIRIEAIPNEDGKSGPDKLYENALKTVLKYEGTGENEVWFVIDTDEWGKQIKDLRTNCVLKNWFVAQSNPCFELWLYYHFENNRPDRKEIEKADGMKPYLNQMVKGGFDNRKHPLHIETAIINSEQNFEAENGAPKYLSTEMHVLAKKIFPLIKRDIDFIKNQQQP